MQSYDKSLIIAHNVLSMVEDLSVKLLLAQFIMKTAGNPKRRSSRSTILPFEYHSVVELSLKLLIKIPVKLQHENRHLIGQPQLIVENLLLSKHIEVVRSLLRDFPSELRNDALVKRAAEKAIDIQNHFRSALRQHIRLQGQCSST